MLHLYMYIQNVTPIPISVTPGSLLQAHVEDSIWLRLMFQKEMTPIQTFPRPTLYHCHLMPHKAHDFYLGVKGESYYQLERVGSIPQGR